MQARKPKTLKLVITSQTRGREVVLLGGGFGEMSLRRGYSGTKSFLKFRKSEAIGLHMAIGHRTWGARRRLSKPGQAVR